MYETAPHIPSKTSSPHLYPSQATSKTLPHNNTYTHISTPPTMIGRSAAMQQVFAKIKVIARSHAPVLIHGETGTGKDLCAQAIHSHSPRSPNNFIALNCAALPTELLESELFGHIKGAFTGAKENKTGLVAHANHGTLFLDEIAELPLNMQAKLLRFLQHGLYRPVGSTQEYQTDTRILCATNTSLIEHVHNNLFREDLFYRLHVLDITLPPLRQRSEDILPLAQHFLSQYNREENKTFVKFCPAAEKTLRQHKWFGNIRALQNLIRKITVFEKGKTVTATMVKTYIDTEISPSGANTQGQDRIRPLWQIEKHAIENTIAYCQGNISQAAEILGINPSTIHRKKADWRNKANATPL